MKTEHDGTSPRSKLATSRGLQTGTASDSLAAMPGLSPADENELYAAMDWLLPRQEAIEKQLARRHLAEGSLVLYDLTSTYFEGRHCPLARFGHSRDERSGNPQIVFGLLTNAQGCPVAVEVFEGNTADPATVAAQVRKLRERFGFQRMVLVGDRGTLTSARLREDLQGIDGMDWITALRAPQIQTLAAGHTLQLSLFDQRDLAEIIHPDYPGERLIACRNVLLAEERARKRRQLLAATEKDLALIVAATQRLRRPLRGKERMALRVGKALGRRKMGKHFQLEIQDDRFTYCRDEANIRNEAALDGIYIIRTTLPVDRASSEEVVRHYKSLAVVERAFRSLKTVDLKVRPIHHRLAGRVRAHVLLCMLAYYVEWHMREACAPLLFQDDQPEAGQALRKSIVAPAQRSPAADQKVRTKRNACGTPVHSFQTLLSDLATIALNTLRMGELTFNMITTPTPLQQQAFDLLKVTCRADCTQ